MCGVYAAQMQFVCMPDTTIAVKTSSKYWLQQIEIHYYVAQYNLVDLIQIHYSL